MIRDHKIEYVDRKSGQILEERVYAKGFLLWSHNTQFGRAATDLFFRHKWVSQVYGWWHKQSWSRRKVKHFVESMNVNMDDSLCSVEDFDNFNDFFTREIDLNKRWFNSDPDICIAPVDGKVLAFPSVESDKTFQIKRSTFNLRELLRSDALTERYTGGSMIISRLSLTDYHHFHFLDSGKPDGAVAINGVYYAAGPYSFSRLIPFYRENYRMRRVLQSDHFGTIAIVEIGAFTVGSIRQRYQPGAHVEKGAHKGFFELGGSTVVLLFEKNMITLDHDLIENTENDLETFVQLGDSIGRKFQPPLLLEEDRGEVKNDRIGHPWPLKRTETTRNTKE